MANKTAKEKNLDFFELQLPKLLTDVAYKGKFIIINDQQIKGSYDSFDSALNFAVGNFPARDFLIQQVIDEKERINFIRSATA